MSQPTLRVTHPDVYRRAIEAYRNGVPQQEIVEQITRESGRVYSPITLSVWASEEGVAYNSSATEQSLAEEHFHRGFTPPRPSTSTTIKQSPQILHPDLPRIAATASTPVVPPSLSVLKRIVPPRPKSPDDQLEERIEVQRKKDIEDAHKRQLAELTRNEARFRRILDLIRETTAAIPMPTVPRAPAPTNSPKSGKERIVAFAISDIQAGISVDPREVGDRLGYNSQTLERRFQKYEQEVWRIIDEQLLIGPVVGIAFWGVGDWIEGHTKRIAARHRTDMGNMTATITLSRHLAAFIDRLRQRYTGIEITVDIIPGNHDMMEKPGDSPCYENFAVLIGELLSVQFRDDPTVQIYTHTQEYALLQYGSSTVLLHHGHGVSAGGNAALPWYGVDRSCTRWMGFHRQLMQVVVLGHFHTTASWNTNMGTKIIVNGAWFAGTSFGASLGLASEAIQVALVLTEDDGVVAQMDILLSDTRLQSTPHEQRAWAERG